MQDDSATPAQASTAQSRLAARDLLPKVHLMRILAFVSLFLATVSAWADTFYVAVTGVNAVTRYDQSGNASTFTNAYVNGPIGVALDRSGNVFVSTNGNTIEKFSSGGTNLGTFASDGVNFPMALIFDRLGNLYVANYAGNTVQKFTPDGTGSVFANVIGPTGLTFDSAGNLYVANFGNTIERFSSTGAPLGTFVSSNLQNPEGIAFDSAGNLYVANNATDSVEKFSPAGADLGAFAQNLGGPVGLAFDSSANLYVVSARDSAIRKITPEGTVSLFAETAFMPAFIAVQPSPSLVNISTRLNILTGQDILDSGFIITGTGTKQVLIRGLGPSLGSAGVSGTLPDPVLELHSSTGGLITVNDNWKQSQEEAISATGIAPTADAEAAILVSLAAGSYTVIEHGKGESTGIGLMEVYDLSSGSGSELVNISTRGLVDIGSGVMIAGAIVSAPAGGVTQVLVRGLGPSLGAQGISQPLPNPVLELYDGSGTLVASNDDWRETQETAIEATGVAPSDDTEAALLATLLPTAYTAIERDKNGLSGVGLIEIYNLH